MKKRFKSTVLCAVLFISIIACNASAAAPISQPADASAPQSTLVTPPNSQPSLPPAVVMKPGTYNQKISVGGTVRSYILHVPPGYDRSKPLPLVFVLHGFGGNAAGMVKLTGMNEKADRENFFVAYLNGTEGTSSTKDVSGLAWNSGLT